LWRTRRPPASCCQSSPASLRPTSNRSTTRPRSSLRRRKPGHSSSDSRRNCGSNVSILGTSSSLTPRSRSRCVRVCWPCSASRPSRHQPSRRSHRRPGRPRRRLRPPASSQPPRQVVSHRVSGIEHVVEDAPSFALVVLFPAVVLLLVPLICDLAEGTLRTHNHTLAVLSLSQSAATRAPRTSSEEAHRPSPWRGRRRPAHLPRAPRRPAAGL